MSGRNPAPQASMCAAGIVRSDSNPVQGSGPSVVSRGVATLLAVVVPVGVLARLYRVDAPLLEVHPPRQYDTAGIARNFYEGSMNILYPQVDWRGNSRGYVEAEFQVYTFLVAILCCLFGSHKWLGRALNIAVYALSEVLVKLARRYKRLRTSLLAFITKTICLRLSLWSVRRRAWGS